MSYDPTQIRVLGAREHNLRGVSITLPKGRLICFTGVSGSGKSSFAFDTLYAEGQRRYIESLSSYARQFIGQLPKPDVDQITGLAPSISIQQKTSGWNPRSTVGTITQVHDYLRVLFARAGVQHCPECARPITAQTREHMIARVLALPEGTRFTLLAPKARQQKGEFKDLFSELIRQGFVRARVDGETIELAAPPALDRYKRHDVEVVVDRLVLRPGVRTRLAEALELALQAGDGAAIVQIEAGPRAPSDERQAAAGDPPADEPGGSAAAARRGRRPSERPARTSARGRRAAALDSAAAPGGAAAGEDILLSAGFACTHCGLSFEPPHPQMFSFNSPQGMCPDCDGLGERIDFDPQLLVPDPTLPMTAPCIAALRRPPGRWTRHFWEGVAQHVGFDLKKPWRELPPRGRQALLYGLGDEHVTFEWRGRRGTWKHGEKWGGIIPELRAKYRKSNSKIVRAFYEQYMRQARCGLCHGARLKPQPLAVRLTSTAQPRPLNIQEVCRLSISDAQEFFAGLELNGVAVEIAREPLKEIRARLQFLLDVGLDYLALDRAAPTLSGGESQRIRLASQIGCGLVGVLYVLDEPSIGLHPRDNQRLLTSLQRLRDMGNTVIVVEHDRDTMEAADMLVDFGPGPGVRGGEIVAAGDLASVSSAERSLTGAYLSGRQEIATPAARRPITSAPPV